jgi:hypothetical protein
MRRTRISAKKDQHARRAQRVKNSLDAIIGIARGTGGAVGRNHNVFLYGQMRR